MAQSGFTPIQLYFSTTAAATPSAGNLANGELAINITDGRLFYKDNGGTVRVLAGTGGSGVVAGSNTQVQFNNNGVFGASANMVFNGTRLTVADLADSGLTAGRVVYVGSGSALVDSAALTFDGTNLGVGVATATAPIDAVSNSSAVGVIVRGRSADSIGTVQFRSNDNTTLKAELQARTDELRFLSAGSVPQTWYVNGSERMRLDSSGNLGLGVTPSAWGGQNAIQFNYGAFSAGTAIGTLMATNSFYNGTNWIYRISSTAMRYTQDSAGHYWHTAPSGTAGNAISFTQAMTLDASGRLGVGTTTLAGRVSSASDAYASFVAMATTTGTGRTVNALTVTDLGATSFANGVYSALSHQWVTDGTERARIDSSGNLLVGTTSFIAGSNARLQVDASTYATIFKSSTTSTNANTTLWHTATSGNNVFIDLGTEGSFTSRGSITYNRGAGLVAYNVTSDYRAKDIIGPVVDSGALIDSVPVYMGKMKGATQERPMFIAHETPEYAHTGEKDAVDVDGKPVYQQMDASALIPVMWAEIQSLRKRLAAAGIA